MAKVSILMNGYNAQKYLKEAIDSVYTQTFSDWEIIFIDNCSTDETKEIVESYDDKIKYYKTEQNIPLGAARNFGLDFCKGEYLAFLDTDDIWFKDKLEKQISIMESDKTIQLSYGGVEFIDAKGDSLGLGIPKATNENVFAHQLKRYEINMQSVVIRNNIKIIMNDQLKHSPDYDLFMEIAAKYQVYVFKDIIVKYRKLSNSLTSKNIAYWGEEMQFTLDRLFENQSLKDKYRDYYDLAYAKVAYNKARYFMSIDQVKEATQELSKYKFLDIKYFVAYFLSLFPKSIWNFVHSYR